MRVSSPRLETAVVVVSSSSPNKRPRRDEDILRQMGAAGGGAPDDGCFKKCQGSSETTDLQQNVKRFGSEDSCMQ